MFCLTITIACLAFISSIKADGDLPLQNPDLFEGDILVDDPVLDRNAIPSDVQRWPGGRVPYQIDPYTTYDEKQLSMIKAAMAEIEAKSCIKFVEKDEDEKDSVLIFAGRGCYSKVGRTGGLQVLSFGKGCFYHGTLVHELGHTIGFFHEHTRSDRDDYLNIHWSQIMDSAKDQFYKLLPFENRLLSPFDYDSIMLYGERTFSKDGWTKTMTAKEEGRKLMDVYDKKGLSDNDVFRINKLYESISSKECWIIQFCTTTQNLSVQQKTENHKICSDQHLYQFITFDHNAFASLLFASMTPRPRRTKADMLAHGFAAALQRSPKQKHM